MARIGVDVGGTNTDLILETTEKDSIGRGVFEHKVPSSLEDQSIAVMQGIVELCDKAGISKDEVDLIVHGTTVATNISIEHNGAEVGMLTTKGFRDILHIGRHKRPYNFSLHFDVPWQSDPLIKRRNRIAISERVLPPHGEVETPLDENEVREAARLLKSRGVEAVIIGFLYSFLNREHELQAKRIVQEEMPGVYVCCSCEVVDVMREYERFSTTAMNAYVGPRTSFYLTHLSNQLRENGIDAELRIMQSNGGVATVESCCERPVNILMSGPAGGVIGGHYFANLDNEQNIITVDIGGTSADISTLVGGDIKIKNPRDAYVADHPVLVPMIDLITIGAGGGSVAYVDEAGGFQVGPRSAGSMPGPACYNRGGTEPTVTDANIVLGRLDPDKMLGGDLKIDPSLSEKAIREKIAEPLGLSVKEAALGILRIVNNNMALAIRSNSVARGVDPRDFVLMPFGGAGPVHGPALAEEVNAKAVLVPPAPGITAAAGLLTTDIQYENTRSLMCELNTIDDAQLGRLQRDLDNLETEILKQLENDGVTPEAMRITRIAECRYHGQGFELRADFPKGPIDRDAVGAVIEAFHAQHEQDYGYGFRDAAVELVTLRVIGNSESQKLEWAPLESGTSDDTTEARIYERETVFDDGQVLVTPRYDRTKLRANAVIEGPALLMQHDSTSLVPPGWVAEVTPHGNLIISNQSA
ncbi:MAG: methylhydantoinase [Oceanospirillaceae bacterium]|nr:methylhydantoinase [Oceanospirillaceae bacterium]